MRVGDLELAGDLVTSSGVPVPRWGVRFRRRQRRVDLGRVQSASETAAELLVAEDRAEAREHLEMFIGSRGESNDEMRGLLAPGDALRELRDREAGAQHEFLRLVR